MLVSGEPGIGKSRLADDFRNSVEREQHTRLRYFCSPHHQDSALFPFIGQLERAAGFVRDDTLSAKLDKLEALLAPNAPAECDVALLAELLSLPFDNRYPRSTSRPQRKKEKTFEALLRQFASLARRQPVLMIFEDLHWADPTSRELLDLSIELAARMPVLLVATFRPEFQPPWTGQPHVERLRCVAWDEKRSGELVRGIIGAAAAVSSEIVDEIVERTDGVPLFIEELTKAVVETAISAGDVGKTVSSVPATSPTVPATLHASLMARLDRLGSTAKEVLQFGAAIGRDFSYELLAAVGGGPIGNWAARSAGSLMPGWCSGAACRARLAFRFKHALVQDIAYGMLLRGPRRSLHARIARALEERFPDAARSGGPKPSLTISPKQGSSRRRSDIGAARAANPWRSRVSSRRSRS